MRNRDKEAGNLYATRLHYASICISCLFSDFNYIIYSFDEREEGGMESNETKGKTNRKNRKEEDGKRKQGKRGEKFYGAYACKKSLNSS